mgnify:CR=1 FL=1
MTLADRSADYLAFVEAWLRDRPTLTLHELVASVSSPDQIAIVSVDLIVGFCHVGPLASPRVAGILSAVSALFTRANEVGITNLLLTQDTHRPDAEEFENYPPHCIADTEESLTAPELAALPFASGFTIAEKNSISSVIAPTYLEWEHERGPFSTYIVVGDCTDLCVYQAALALKVRSQAQHLGQRVIVPIDCVETYDLPVHTARAIGAQPHPGDLLHHVFLHSMAQNGVEVVATIA